MLLKTMIPFLDEHQFEIKVHFARGGKHNPEAALTAFLAGEFKEWQEYQSRRNFEREYILSLIRLGHSQWLFGGIYRTIGCTKIDYNRYRYDTELVNEGLEFVGKAIVKYRREFRQSYCNLENFVDVFEVIGNGVKEDDESSATLVEKKSIDVKHTVRVKRTPGLCLGLSRIGDLLLDSKITYDEHGNSIDNVLLRIPEYQRPYKWTAKNANQLLDDIIEAMNANKEVYRVGTLILHEDEEGYNIVDGQQRTITFSLLLKVLDPDAEIPFLNQKLSDNTFNLHNVINNYRALQRRLAPLQEEDHYRELQALKEYVEDRCELIVVITDDLSEAFQFFDSQNARGKALYPHDLLKAYHLREMRSLDVQLTEQIVKTWEDLDQKKLAVLFNDYLYRLKEWVNGERSYELNEHNIDMFKGVTSLDNYPYAQFYKGAFAYADQLNQSQTPFVTGVQDLRAFQLNAPIIAGKPFFDYAKHYFDILADIQNNDMYEGFFINGNEIVKTLDLRHYRNGVGNHITRLMFDTAILLYVDRFCPGRPTKADLDYLDQFVDYAFIWAYSMRAQYKNVGWLVAQNYILGTTKKDEVVNSFNIYKTIADSDSPRTLINRLSDLIMPLDDTRILANKTNVEEEKDNVYQNYLYFFKEKDYWENRI